MAELEPLVEVRNLKKFFPLSGGVFRKVLGYVRAVDDISFDIYKGETLGLVGESGCGKTTTGRTILNLIPATSGQVLFEGRDVTNVGRGEMRDIRRNMSIVFQDPMASLDPRITIKKAVGEPLLVNGIARGYRLRQMVLELLEKVGLNEDHLNRFPHEFSGGQRQRICIARALALRPKFVVMDEPTSSTDVSVQAQTLNLMKDLQDEFDLTYLFISHNLSVVKHMSDRVAVMYLGKIVEMTPKDIFQDAMHPYSAALVSAVPVPDPTLRGRAQVLAGEVPSPINPPSGCRFHPR
ncbi:MAG: peptide ABC transporter substrate-binding protein, partial [Candidatus Thorarchaeota archaeon]